MTRAGFEAPQPGIPAVRIVAAAIPMSGHARWHVFRELVEAAPVADR